MLGSIALSPASITIWSERGPEIVGPSVGPGEASLLREATAQRRSIWLQLSLPELDEQARRWFEGSLDPWAEVPEYTVDWDPLEGLLPLLGLPFPRFGDDADREARMLYLLPHTYAGGMVRAAQEVTGSNGPLEDLRVFPTVGFELETSRSLPRFWTMRMSLAVIRNVVVTVRLPDLLCAGRLSARQFSSRPRGAIRIPDRFFPSGLDVAAEDVADTIALHQATTARAVSEEVRLKLEEVEDRWSPDSGDRERQHRDALEDARQVTEITETVQQLDAQLSRLLRRFGSHGDRADAEGTLPEIKLRYRFALDELRSLLADCRLASETVGRGIASSEQNDRERFHFVAAILGAAILFPTLVASVYGANVALPAQNSWGGFIALLLFISAFALAGLLAISEAWEKGWVPSGERMLRGRLRSAAVVYAALAFAIGVVIVVTG